jgi:hypothetical protein
MITNSPKNNVTCKDSNHAETDDLNTISAISAMTGEVFDV